MLSKMKARKNLNKVRILFEGCGLRWKDRSDTIWVGMLVLPCVCKTLCSITGTAKNKINFTKCYLRY